MTFPVEDLIIQQLLEFDPTFDVGGGVATTGLMIEPLSIILQPIVNELIALQDNQSILTILEQDDPDDFPEDIVDGLASNAFVDRILGEIATTTQRVRFFEPQDFSATQGVLVFRGPSGQRFTNALSISVTEAEMSLNIDGGLVYVDISIIAMDSGTAHNVDAGSISEMEAEPVGVANTTNLFDVEDGRDRETNTELIDRIKIAVTVRALVTGRGIIVTLTENFTTIVEVQPVGFGDDEMMRDIVYNVHIGGNVDVYVRTATLTSSSTDVTTIEIDTTRQMSASTVLAALVEGTAYDLLRRSLDRTVNAPVVASIDGFVTYSEGAGLDYTIDDTLGTITRVAGSTIFHIPGTIAKATTTKRLVETGAFGSVKAGMILTVGSPAALVGTYTVRSKISSDEIEIYGEFPAAGVPSAADVNYAIDDNLEISFDHNPISIDLIEAARSATRSPFTIFDVPTMRLVSMAVLDPISGEPTGELLDTTTGFGAGGFGEGGFGSGGGGDFRLVVTEPTLRFSQKEDNFLDFNLEFLGYSLRVSYIYASAIEAIQTFVESDQERTEAADLLVRHFNPAFVDTRTDIAYQINLADEPTAITVAAMTTLVTTFIDDIDSGDDLEASDLIDLLYDNGAVRVDLDTILDMLATLHHHNGQTEFLLMNAKGVMAVPDDAIPDPTDKPISPRIARYIGGDITLVRTSV
ncbi:hypothetical protein LCGC14_1095530 [marine sediment metagenome]|uniref:Baseplate protein J-like barrel domain-containing protein n=1 Tax=marine sediment metagenome TaxID=412755 RepID=A0A0F9MYV5_9ZZZZ